MPTNFLGLKSEILGPHPIDPLRFFPADNQVRFTPDAWIFWVDGLDQKEKIGVSSDELLPMTCSCSFGNTGVCYGRQSSKRHLGCDECEKMKYSKKFRNI